MISMQKGSALPCAYALRQSGAFYDSERCFMEALRKPILAGMPLRGDWLCPNTPGSKVPSHGTNRLGTRYAYDFVQADWTRRGWPAYRGGLSCAFEQYEVLRAGCGRPWRAGCRRRGNTYAFREMSIHKFHFHRQIWNIQV